LQKLNKYGKLKTRFPNNKSDKEEIMTQSIGFTLNEGAPENIGFSASDATGENTEAKHAAEPKPQSLAAIPKPPAQEEPNKAFYYLTVEFAPKGVSIQDPGIIQHIYQSIVHEHPLAIMVPGVEVSSVMIPVRNDKWPTVKPVIDRLETGFELSVVRFNVEAMVPQIVAQQQQAQLQAYAAASQRGLGSGIAGL
jgi:hypothetical protein